MARRAGEAPLDRWSWTHLASGFALGMLLANPWVVLGLLAGFEALEAALRRLPGKAEGGLFQYESWSNVAADIVVGMVGYLIAHFGMEAAGRHPILA